MKIKLEISKRIDLFSRMGKIIPIISSLPFAFSTSGKYMHRPRSANIHYNKRGEITHTVVALWCGGTVMISEKKHGKFSETSQDRPICSTCEGRAIGAGLLDSQKINGRPVMFSSRKNA